MKRGRSLLPSGIFVLKTLAPSLNLTMDMEELPLSVKPEQNVSLADMNRLLRETYEGTEWDMTKRHDGYEENQG